MESNLSRVVVLMIIWQEIRGRSGSRREEGKTLGLRNADRGPPLLEPLAFGRMTRSTDGYGRYGLGIGRMYSYVDGGMSGLGIPE
jgi:hypothetical protein